MGTLKGLQCIRGLRLSRCGDNIPSVCKECLRDTQPNPSRGPDNKSPPTFSHDPIPLQTITLAASQIWTGTKAAQRQND
jgi:hypothetical protein